PSRSIMHRATADVNPLAGCRVFAPSRRPGGTVRYRYAGRDPDRPWRAAQLARESASSLSSRPACPLTHSTPSRPSSAALLSILQRSEWRTGDPSPFRQPRASQPGDHSTTPLTTYMESVRQWTGPSSVARATAISSIRWLVVDGSDPHRRRGPSSSTTAQPPGPGLPRQLPSVQPRLTTAPASLPDACPLVDLVQGRPQLGGQGLHLRCVVAHVAAGHLQHELPGHARVVRHPGGRPLLAGLALLLQQPVQLVLDPPELVSRVPHGASFLGRQCAVFYGIMSIPMASLPLSPGPTHAVSFFPLFHSSHQGGAGFLPRLTAYSCW